MNIFMPPEIYYGSAPSVPQTTPGRNVNYAPTMNMGRAGSAKSGLPKGGLTSDIEYYNKMKADIEARMQEIADTKGMDSAEYKEATREWYDLDKNVLPTLQSKKETYNQALQRIRSQKSFDAPAIIENKALVRDLSNEGELKVIDKYELLKNPKNYQIVTLGQAASYRAENPAFSGYTEEGKIVDEMMNALMGNEQYNKTILNKIQTAAGLKFDRNGKLRDIHNNELNFNTLKFDENGLGLIEASKPIDDVLTYLMNQSTPTESTYLDALAIQKLHTTLNLLGKGFKDETDLQTAIDNTKKEILVKRLQTAKAATKASGSTGSKDKEFSIDPVQYSLLTILRNKRTVEADNPADENTESILWNTPSVKIPGGIQLLTHGMSDDDGTRIGKSQFLVEATSGIKNITLADGTPLYKLIDGDGDGHSKVANKAAIDTSRGLYVLVAPVIKKQGRDVVDFSPEYLELIQEATKEALEKIDAAGIDVSDLQAHYGSERVQNIRKEIDAEFKKKLQERGMKDPGITMQFVFAFRAFFDADGDALDNPYVRDEGAYENNIMKAIRGELDGDPASAMVFVPMSADYRRSLYSSKANKKYGLEPMPFDNFDAFHEAFRSKIDVGKAESDALVQQAAASQNNINQRVKKEEKGGKIATSNEIYDLLFK